MKHLNTLGVLLLSAHLLLQLLRGLPLCQSIIVTRVTLSSLKEENVFARVVSCWSAPPKIGDCWMREKTWGGIFAQNMQILSQISFAEISLPSKCQKKLLSMLETSFQWKFQWKEDLYSRNLFQIVFSPYLPISLFISQKVFRVPALKPTVNSSSRFDFFQMKKIIENSVNYVWRLSIRKKLSLLCRWEPENSRLSDNCREKTLTIYFFSSDPLIVATNVWSTNLNTYM